MRLVPNEALASCATGALRTKREVAMTFQNLIGPFLVAAIAICAGNAGAADDAKYPDWSGQWERFVVRGLPGQPSFDQTKPWGFGQEAPLTPEYRKVLEESMADQAAGGLGNYHTPRCLAAGMPLMINESLFKERIWRDKADPKIMHDEITVIDHALTRPWTVDKKYVLNPDPRPQWPEYYCGEYNAQTVLGKDNYFLSADGLLMPARKDQPPPDLRYFKRTSK
jgi:hypothetical protein